MTSPYHGKLVICRPLQYVDCPGGGNFLIFEAFVYPAYERVCLCTHNLWEVYLLKKRDLFPMTASKSIERLFITSSYYNSAPVK